MNDRSPHVSIGLPVYNGEEYLSLAVQSVLDQTYHDLELVISDNASTDATEQICREFAAADPRVKYSRSLENKGAAWNYNQTFALSRGEYFRWLAADDMLAPTLIEKSAFILDSYPAVVLCFTWTRDIDENGRELAIKPSTRRYAGRRPSDRFYSLGEVVPWHNCEEVFGLIRANILANTDLIANYTDSDRTLLAELALCGPFYEIAEPLFWHRLHDQSSVVVNPNSRERAAWFDPKLKNKRVYPVWRQTYEMMRVVNRTPLPIDERFQTYINLLRWTRRRRKALYWDLRGTF